MCNSYMAIETLRWAGIDREHKRVISVIYIDVLLTLKGVLYRHFII